MSCLLPDRVALLSHRFAALDVGGLLTRLRTEAHERDYQVPETEGAVPGWAWCLWSWVTVTVGITVTTSALLLPTGVWPEP